MAKKRKPSGPPRFSHHFLREWRKKAGLTLEQVGERVGRSHATIQRIEARKQAVTQPVLDDLARVYQTTRGKLLDEKPPS